MSRFTLNKWCARTLPVAASLCLLALASCDGSDPASNGADTGGSQWTIAPAKAGDEGETGTLSLELQTSGGISLNSFDYAITGPNYSRADKIDVSNSNTLSARIDGLPAASGYSITVTGSSTGSPSARCAGSATFDILARTVNNVPISVSCHVRRSVSPPSETAVPMPPAFTWLYGLALLLMGVKISSRSRLKIG